MVHELVVSGKSADSAVVVSRPGLTGGGFQDNNAFTIRSQNSLTVWSDDRGYRVSRMAALYENISSDRFDFRFGFFLRLYICPKLSWRAS